MVNRVPSSSRLCQSMAPPTRSMMLFTMESPQPVSTRGMGSVRLVKTFRKSAVACQRGSPPRRPPPSQLPRCQSAAGKRQYSALSGKFDRVIYQVYPHLLHQFFVAEKVYLIQLDVHLDVFGLPSVRKKQNRLSNLLV